MKDSNRFLKPKAPSKAFSQPKPLLQTTTLWDFPSQHYGNDSQGDGEYSGVTPSHVIWNFLQRYTRPSALVLDPMCGSGTTIDVCKDTGRRFVAFDIAPTRDEIGAADARKLPLGDASVDAIFMDPPYSNHIRYSGDERCIGELDARKDNSYFESMEKVIAESFRVLKNGGYLGIYIQDSAAKSKPFIPLGFEIYLRCSLLFDPVDIISVCRYNKSLKRNHWHTSAIEGNYYLRGFNYFFIFRKNTGKEPSSHHHEKSGTVSSFFKDFSRKNKASVVTPEAISQALLASKNTAVKPPSAATSKPKQAKSNKKVYKPSRKHRF